MIWNRTFTSYRYGVSGTGRNYSASATITNGAGYFEPASDELKSVLNLDSAVDVYQLLTEETNILETDKIVIDSVNYYAFAVSEIIVGALRLTKVLLNKKKS